MRHLRQVITVHVLHVHLELVKSGLLHPAMVLVITKEGVVTVIFTIGPSPPRSVVQALAFSFELSLSLVNLCLLPRGRFLSRILVLLQDLGPLLVRFFSLQLGLIILVIANVVGITAQLLVIEGTLSVVYKRFSLFLPTSSFLSLKHIDVHVAIIFEDLLSWSPGE